MSWDVCFDTSAPVARKRHKCETCWRHIEPGEKYSRQTGKFDGQFFSRADCRFCVYAWAQMHKAYGGYDEDLQLDCWAGDDQTLAALFFHEAVATRWAYCRPSPRLAVAS